MAQRTYQIPKVCRAAVCVERGENFKIELREDYPVPTPLEDEILIKLNVTGLCHSDIHHMKGDLGLGAKADCVGHEGAGVVVAMGSRVEDWAIGDRAGIKPCMSTCGKCEFCTEGYELNCPKRIMSAYFRNGTYCQYLTAPSHYTTRLPKNIPDHLAAPVLCAGATIYRAIQVSGAKINQWLVVPGAGGGVGSLAAQYATAQGIRVIAVDTSAEKKKMCLDTLGCEAFIDFKEVSSIPEEVKRITGSGAHALIVTGGTKAAYANWTDILRIGGTLVCVGLPPRGVLEVGADPIVYVSKSLTVKGTLVANYRETDDALAIVDSGKVTPVVTVYPFSEWVETLEKLHQGQITGRACIRFED